MSPFMTLHHGASALGRIRRRLLTLITGVTLVAPLLIVGAMPVAATLVYADPAQTTIEPASSTAGVTDTVAVVVVLRDSSGLETGEPEGPVALSSSLAGSSITAPNDEGNGTWTAELTTTVPGLTTITGTVDGQDITGNSPVTVDFFGPLDHFTVDAIDTPATAGSAIGITVTAYDTETDDHVKKDYGGTNAVLTATLENSPAPSGTAPTIGSLTWLDGVGTASVTPTNAEPVADQSVTVADASLEPDVSASSNLFAVLPGPVASFTWDSITGLKTAGTGFGVSITAYDAYSNVKTDYDGTNAGLTGPADSPACASCSVGATSFDPGTFDWATVPGTGTSTVTLYLAGDDQVITITDSETSASANSGPIDVAAATADALDFSVDNAGDAHDGFNGEPTTTKKGTPVYHSCAVGGSPCGAGSEPVQVLVRDAYGNVVQGATVTLTGSPALSGTPSAVSDATGVTGSWSVPIQVANASATGDASLTASASGATDGTSQTFQLVDDLDVCQGSACANFGNTSGQSSYGKITTTNPVSGSLGPTTVGGLDGVTLVTQFQGLIGSECVGAPTTGQIGKTTDVHVELEGGATTNLAFGVALIIPKSVLQADGIASRNIAAFNVCFGATDLSGSASGWTQKKLVKNGPTVASPDGGLWWGWLPDCSKKLSADNPCISLRTKTASTLQAALGLSNGDFAALGFHSGDLAIVYKTVYPWDAKGSIF